MPVRFRPCIDLHAGVVKQIVGSTLRDAAAGEAETPTTNFVATLDASHYAGFVAHRTDRACGRRTDYCLPLRTVQF